MRKEERQVFNIIPVGLMIIYMIVKRKLEKRKHKCIGSLAPKKKGINPCLVLCFDPIISSFKKNK